MSKPIHKHHTIQDAQHHIANEFDEVKAWLSAFPTTFDFLHFYSMKLKSLYNDNEKALEIVESYKVSSKELTDLEEQLQVRDKLSFRLQECISEAEMCIHNERENYLRLIADNEQLKLVAEDFRRKFHTALLLSGTQEKDVTHFLQRHAKANEITDEMIQVKEEIRICTGDKTNNFEMLDSAILSKQVNILEKHLEETKTMHQEKLLSLKKSFKLCQEEYGIRIECLQDRLLTTVQKLEDKKSLLHKSIVDILILQQQIILNQDEWLEQRKRFMFAVKSGAYRVSEAQNLAVPDARKEDFNDQTPLIKQLQRNISRYEIQLMDKDNLVMEHKMQIWRLEKQVHRLKEENDEQKNVCYDQTKKLHDRNVLLQKQLEKSEMRRKLDGDGFRADVKSIKIVLKGVDTQLHALIRRGICDNDTVDTSPASQISVPPTRQSSKAVLKLSSKRLRSTPTLGAAVVERGRRRHHSRSSYVKTNRYQLPQVSDPPTTIKSLKEYEDSSRITRVAFAKLLEVAQEKLKFLDQLLTKTEKSHTHI